MKASLAVAALRNAIARRDPVGTVVHSDRGSQFRSNAFVRTLKNNGLVGSMGRVGACGDNAAMESFFALLQKNVLDRQRWTTRGGAAAGDHHLDRAHVSPPSAATPTRPTDTGRIRDTQPRRYRGLTTPPDESTEVGAVPVLGPLARVGWTITHDLELPGAGNVDHLAVGPPGVFVLDSKAWSGVVAVDQDGATITPRDDPEAAWLARGQRRVAGRATARVARALAAATGMTVLVARSVVVVWSPFPQRVATSGEVTYVAGEHLHNWLLGQRACLNRTQLEALREANTPSLLTDTPHPV